MGETDAESEYSNDGYVDAEIFVDVNGDVLTHYDMQKRTRKGTEWSVNTLKPHSRKATKSATI